MAILVYRLTCTASGKSYVGITARALDTRWFEHCQRAREGARESRLYDAMRKYGLDAWTREVIGTADTDDEARMLERAFICDLGTFENGYNANLGGHGALHFTAEQRKKIGDAQRGKIIPPETRAKMSAAKKGDRRMALHLGDNVNKGAGNPRARECAIRLPDGTVQTVRGLRAFCRENRLQIYKLKKRPSHKGFTILDRAAVAATSGKME